MRDIEEILSDIVDVCQDFCDENYIDVEVEIDDDFGYYKKEKVVGITIATDERAEYFMDNAIANGLENNCGDFILSFFHEIGHHYTLDWLTKSENKKCDKIKSKLDGSIKEDNYTYFQVFDEVLATDWAIDFINLNQDLIRDFANKLIPLVSEIELED